MKINRVSQDYTFYVLNLGSDPMFLDSQRKGGGGGESVNGI